ncbi:MAG: hypothetical protein P4L91_17150 [Burkholderiaceae bacterium]|nr:hypothetical protein [Burkholderiaceae bacterium]
MGDESLKLTCAGCGARLAYSATHQALKCEFCGTIAEIHQEETISPRNAPSSIVPLSVELTTLTDAVYEYLASGDLTPDSLLECATFTRKERFYAPAYAFPGEFDVHWTASFGYDRTEYYTVIESRTQNGQTQRVPVSKSRTVTDWNPANGADTGSFSVIAYAGKRLLGSNQAVADLLEKRSATGSVAFDPSYTSDIPMEEFGATESAAYKDRATPQINNIIDQSIRRYAQGNHQKDWHWQGNINTKGAPLYVPVCHAVYEFEGKQYNFWAHGADVSRHVADPLPVDQKRQNAIQMGFVPFTATFISAAFAIFKFDSDWTVPLVCVAAAGLYGLVRKTSIIVFSLEIRKSLLARRQAASKSENEMSTVERDAFAKGATKKPRMANTDYDNLVLPFLTLLFAATPFVQVLSPSKDSPPHMEGQAEAATPRVEQIQSTGQQTQPDSSVPSK